MGRGGGSEGQPSSRGSQGLTFPVISFPIMFYYLILFETKGEDKRIIALLEGTKAWRGCVPLRDEKCSCLC